MIGGVVLIATIGLLIAGLELTSTYKDSVTINAKGPVQTRKEIIINATPEKVWTIMSGIDQWPRWHKDVQSSKLEGAFQSGSSFHWKSGGLNIHSTLHTAIPFSDKGWSGKAFGAFAIHNWTFTKMKDCTKVRVEESMEGWLIKLMRDKFHKGLEQSLDVWLRNLKTKAENQ